MANKRIRNIIIIIVAALLVCGAVAAAILFIPWNKPDGTENSDTPSSAITETVTSEENDEIDPSGEKTESENKEGQFTDADPDEQKKTDKGELGGSSTLDVIKPENSSDEATSSTESETEWIEGIW